MKQVYAIILHPEKEGGYSVYVPDLEIGTQGETVAECMDMARDAIGLWAITRQDIGQSVPPPSNGLPTAPAPDIVTFVDIDIDAYRRAHEARTIRKNVTIPGYLNDAAEMAGVNFSQVLQEALKHRLNMD